MTDAPGPGSGHRLRLSARTRELAGRIDLSRLEEAVDDHATQKARGKSESRALLRVGSRLHSLESIFEIKRLARVPERTEIEGSRRYLGLGADMTRGVLVVEGHAGDGAAAGMRGGEISISGDAGHELGAGMRGGRVIVHGNAGDRVGAAPADDERGMRGGEIVVHGRVGDDVGLRMRRGLIAIAGEVGSTPGRAMLAGTIVVGRGRSPFPGLAMKRGTVIFLDAKITDWTPAPHLASAGSAELVFMQPLLCHLTSLGLEVSSARDGGAWNIYASDVLGTAPGDPRGRGEIIVAR